MNGRILVTGDIHRDFKRIRDISNKLNTTKEDTLILLGDCGFNYFLNYRDDTFKNKISNYPITIFAIRGNHEARPQDMLGKWHYELFFENRVIVEDKYPNIKYALDGYDYYIPNGKNKIHAFVIGGAYSVDKFYRIEHRRRWFKNEQLNEREMEDIKNYLDWLYKANKPIDLFLSHTAPITYEPTDLFLSVVDQSTVDKTMERFLGKIEQKYPKSIYMWGHYHANREYPYVENVGKRTMLFNDVIDLNNYINNQIYINLLERE